MDCLQRLDYNSCCIKTRENVKRNKVASLLSQTSAEWQVDKLTKEVTSLALQLDESLTYVRWNNNEQRF